MKLKFPFHLNNYNFIKNIIYFDEIKNIKKRFNYFYLIKLLNIIKIIL